MRDTSVTDVKPGAPRLMPAAPLSKAIWGMSGPVWTMTVWSALASILLFASLILPMTDSTAFPRDTIGAAVLFSIFTAIPLILRSRTPAVFPHFMVTVWIIVTCWLMYNAQPLEISLLFDGFMITAVYVGYWMTSRKVASYAALWAGGSAIALLARGIFDELIMLWIAEIAISVSIAVFLNMLVRYLGQAAIHDPLTGLLNRAGLDVAITPLHARSEDLKPVTVALIDLDGFKEINDTKGHLAGDDILRGVAKSIIGGLRKHDIAARSGGDEFIIVLPHTTPQQATDIVSRIGERFGCGWSVGVSEWQPTENFDAAVHRADEQMYQNKHSKPSRQARKQR